MNHLSFLPVIRSCARKNWYFFLVLVLYFLGMSSHFSKEIPFYTIGPDWFWFSNIAQNFTSGLVPWRDFYNPYGFLFTYPAFFIYHFFQNNAQTMYLHYILLNGAGILAFYLITKVYFRTRLFHCLLLTVGVFYDLLWYRSSYGAVRISLALLGCVCIVSLTHLGGSLNEKNRNYFLLGAILGLLFLISPNMAILPLLICGFYFIVRFLFQQEKILLLHYFLTIIGLSIILFVTYVIIPEFYSTFFEIHVPLIKGQSGFTIPLKLTTSSVTGFLNDIFYGYKVHFVWLIVYLVGFVGFWFKYLLKHIRPVSECDYHFLLLSALGLIFHRAIFIDENRSFSALIMPAVIMFVAFCEYLFYRKEKPYFVIKAFRVPYSRAVSVILLSFMLFGWFSFLTTAKIVSQAINFDSQLIYQFAKKLVTPIPGFDHIKGAIEEDRKNCGDSQVSEKEYMIVLPYTFTPPHIISGLLNPRFVSQSILDHAVVPRKVLKRLTPDYQSLNLKYAIVDRSKSFDRPANWPAISFLQDNFSVIKELHNNLLLCKRNPGNVLVAGTDKFVKYEGVGDFSYSVIGASYFERDGFLIMNPDEASLKNRVRVTIAFEGFDKPFNQIVLPIKIEPSGFFQKYYGQNTLRIRVSFIEQSGRVSFKYEESFRFFEVVRDIYIKMEPIKGGRTHHVVLELWRDNRVFFNHVPKRVSLGRPLLSYYPKKLTIQGPRS